MRRTLSSRTSSIASASRNYHWDVVNIANNQVQGAAAVNTVVEGKATAFPRSNVLGVLRNARTNEGLVHLIRKIRTHAFLQSSGVAEAGFNLFWQMRRRESGAIVADLLSGNKLIDEVMFEDRLVGGAFQESSGTAGTQQFNDVHQHTEIDFGEFPMVAVLPYYADVVSLLSNTAATTLTMNFTVSVYVESIRVAGQAYRRLLDHYTQAPTLIERRE